MALLVKNLPATAGDLRDACLIPGAGRSPGEGNGNPLQYSCLENSMDRGAWWAIYSPKNRKELEQLSTWYLLGPITIFLKTRSCMIRILLSVPNKDVNTLKWCGYSCCYRFTMSLSFSVKLTLLITTIWCLLSFFLVPFSESNWFSGFPFLFIKFPYTQT